MALLKYFKRIEPGADEQIESVLSKTNGALSQLMPIFDDDNDNIRTWLP